MPGIGSQAVPKPPSRYHDRAEKQAQKVAEERRVYALVTNRDDHCCRVCGKFCNPRAMGLLAKAHHHHLVYRSRGGETTITNVLLLCPKCHAEEHDGRLRLSGDAELRDPVTGRLAGVKVERPSEEGWLVIGWV